MKQSRKAGFTLIELLVVVMIIGILAVIAIPQYFKVIERSRAAEAVSIMSDIMTGESIYYLDHGSYTINLKDLEVKLPKSKISSEVGTNRNNIFRTRAFLIKMSILSGQVIATATYGDGSKTLATPAGGKYQIIFTLDSEGDLIRQCKDAEGGSSCTAVAAAYDLDVVTE